MGSYNQSYLGMPTPQAVGQAQTAAQTGTSSVPGGGSPLAQGQTAYSAGTGQVAAPKPITDYSGGNAYLQGLNYGAEGQGSSGTPQGPSARSMEQAQLPQGHPAAAIPGVSSTAVTTGNYGGPQSRNPLAQPITSFTPGTGPVAAPTPITQGVPNALQGITGIRQILGGQWMDSEGRVYNPTTGQVLYNPIGSGPGQYIPGGANPTPGYFSDSGYVSPWGGNTGFKDQAAYFASQAPTAFDLMSPSSPPTQPTQPTTPTAPPPPPPPGGPGSGATGPGGAGPGGGAGQQQLSYQDYLALQQRAQQAFIQQYMQQQGQSGGGASGVPAGGPNPYASLNSGGPQASSGTYQSGPPVGNGGTQYSTQSLASQMPSGANNQSSAQFSNSAQFPNTYPGQFQNYPQQTYTPNPFVGNTPPPTMFSGNEGPQAGAVGRPPEGYGVVPPYSPAMSQMYFQYLMNQVGQGASPYGQQNTFLPSQGQTAMTGLSAPMNPFSQYAQNALTSHIGNIGNLLDPNNLQAMMGQYGGYQNAASNFAQYGGSGYPGQQLGLQAQYGAVGNPADPYGLYTGAQALQGSASGVGQPGLPGQYLNSAMQYGGMGLPAQTQSAFAQYGAGPGAGGQTLSNMAQFGNPTDVGPAWEAMKAAQQRNIEQGAAQIREKMGLSGNLGLTGGGQALGTPYGTALTDYYNQAIANQNANLTQAQQQAQEAARQRMLSAAGTMSGQQLGAAQNLGALQQQAGLFGAGQQTANSQYLQNLMAQGLGQMNQNQQFGMGQGANITGMSQQIPNQIYQNYLQQMGGQIGNALNLGQQYQGLDQNAINRQYQEFLRTQPEYSPLLQQLFAGATTFPGVVNTRFGSGAIPTAIGQGLGYLGGLFGMGGGGG